MLAERLLRKEEMAMPQKEIMTPKGTVLIKGPVSPGELADLSMDEGLKAFRVPARQHQALIEIAAMEGGRIFIAENQGAIIGYVTFHPPDAYERWGRAGLQELLELGGIEVSPDWRGYRLSYSLLETAFSNEQLEDYIVIATEYCWHWDLKGTGLTVWEYRNLMERLMGSAGMKPLGTDDPEICSHPANMLTVRVGSRISADTFMDFETLRYQSKFMF